MAIPTITSIDPTGGLASGRSMATIVGTNFRLPSDVVLESDFGDWPQSVAVYVNGRAADGVAVLDAETIQIITPEFMGDPATIPVDVDVLVQNLDDAGDPIPTEEATLSDGYTYRRPDLTAISAADWITYQLVLTLRRNLIANVSVDASPDWSDDPTTQITYVGELPAVTIDGPVIRENKLLRDPDARDEEGDVGSTRKAPPYTADLLYAIMLVGRNKPEALSLQTEALRYFDRRPDFVFPAGPSDPTEIDCRLFVEGDWDPTDRFGDQTYAYTTTIRLEGLPFDDAHGVASAGVPIDDFFTEQLPDEDVGEFLILTTEAIES
jgi:hypothetical protein